MQNAFRSVAWLTVAVLFVLVLTLFVHFFIFFLKIALIVALLAFAYYWFTRATETRRRNGPWR